MTRCVSAELEPLFLYNGVKDQTKRSNGVFYLADHNNIVPHSRSVVHPDRLHFRRGHQDTGGAVLSEQGHTGEQVGCRAVQGELDLQDHRPSVQPAAWVQEIQFGCGVRPDDDDDTEYHWDEIYLLLWEIISEISSTMLVSV